MESSSRVVHLQIVSPLYETITAELDIVGPITLAKLRKACPIEGRFHFRHQVISVFIPLVVVMRCFQVDLGGDLVWLDLIQEDKPVSFPAGSTPFFRV